MYFYNKERVEVIEIRNPFNKKFNKKLSLSFIFLMQNYRRKFLVELLQTVQKTSAFI